MFDLIILQDYHCFKHMLTVSMIYGMCRKGSLRNSLCPKQKFHDEKMM